MKASPFLVTIVAATALAMVGCGRGTESAEPTAAASTSASGSAAPGRSEAMLAFSQCMRDNGVSDFPDPTEEGISLAGTGVDVDSPTFKAAERVCKSLVPQSPASSNDAQWTKVVPGGKCQCADGSRFFFWERRGDPAKVVFYLDGGGACWDARTCAFTTGEEQAYVWHLSSDDPEQSGIFDFDQPENPFAGYSFVYVPYCTGDVHLGDAANEYTSELTVQHKGFVNGTTALAHLVQSYPDADQVVVVGLSAGSVAAPVYAGLVSDGLPDARVTVLADGSGAYPDDPDLNVEILGQWGAFQTMPVWTVNQGLTARDWGIPRFWVQVGLHEPEIVMARFDYAFDEEQASRMRMLDLDTSKLVSSIDGNEEAIEDAGVIQHSYTAPGTEHGIVADGAFYGMEVSGVRLVDWVEALIAGEPLDDVHCNECGAP